MLINNILDSPEINNILNILDIILNSCQGKQACRLLASNSIFGDACPGTQKYLEVHYQCLPNGSTSKAQFSNTQQAGKFLELNVLLSFKRLDRTGPNRTNKSWTHLGSCFLLLVLAIHSLCS